MNPNSSLQSAIKALEQELLDLKTAKRAGSLIKPTIHRMVASQIYLSRYLIEYADDAPAITILVEGYYATFSTQQGRQQYCMIQPNITGHFALMSTRPIVSITYAPE